MAPMMSETWTTMGSTIASAMFIWAMIRQFFPYQLRRHLEVHAQRLMAYFNPYIRISIHEFTGDRLQRSKVYTAVEAYLSANTSKSARKLKVEMGKESKKLELTLDEHERVTDEYNGAKIWWVSSIMPSRTTPSRTTPSGSSSNPDPERRFYKLTFHKRYREIITESYLEHVLKEGKEIRVKNRQRKLYTNSSNYRWPTYKHTMWSHIVFEHPASFRTLAMEPQKKQEIIDDLLTFSESKDYYSKIGKAWKRGYLLYGPPGTGKSTMIAAMANLLNYDVYDLELTAVTNNTDLRKLLIETTSKSIIVIEDIDCSLDLTGQRKKRAGKSADDETNGKDKNEVSHKEHKEEKGSKVTLSGLLNFIDGLWSACGKERLIVFTTNYVEKLDPALIRRGRMDKHIELSYCSFEGFKVLAKNYLDLETHPMFETIHQLIMETKITPADVAENLMPKSPGENTERRLMNLIQVLQEAEAENLKLAKEEDNTVQAQDIEILK